ncbi:MAG: cytochrome C [Gammaproteobacteria bacterium]
MTTSRSTLMAAVAACFAAGAAWAGSPGQTSNHSKLWQHGKYLVTQAAPCSDCHTPRNRQGELVASRALQGAPIDLKPMHPVPGWAVAAPGIAGLPAGWSFDQTAHFLETGLTPSGGHAGPPMPAFRFNARDARAVATYLQSLPSAKAAATTRH